MDYRVEELMIDRLVGEAYAEIVSRLHHPQSREFKPAGLSQTLNRSPLAVEIEAGRSRHRPRMGKRRRSGTGRNGRYRDDGRRGFVGNTGEVCRGGRGYLGSRLTLRA